MQHVASLTDLDDVKVAVIGLGYVGLPLAVEFGKKRHTIGFDIKPERIAELRNGDDSTGEVERDALASATKLVFSSDFEELASCNVYIIAVPTPIDAHRQPNLRPLIGASELVGKVIKTGDIVIYESTVYPGATEEECLPVVEKISGLTYNRDFFAGYSPERINPGDKERPLPKIVKVTSGSTPEVADLVDALYRTIITAGTFKAANIKVAEASKVIENTQRDVNIALINELSIIFSHLDIDTSSVLEAAATKWNFMKLSPGLVGGHCIGVDPYYLVHKAMAVGHIPDVIRHSREINDGMARNATNRLVKTLIKKGHQVKGAKVLLLGFTFKENCPDVRNTKIVDLVENLESFGMDIDICDTWADPAEVQREYGRAIATKLPPATTQYEAIVLAVGHQEFIVDGVSMIHERLSQNGVFFDMKAVFSIEDSDLRL